MKKCFLLMLFRMTIMSVDLCIMSYVPILMLSGPPPKLLCGLLYLKYGYAKIVFTYVLFVSPFCF